MRKVKQIKQPVSETRVGEWSFQVVACENPRITSVSRQWAVETMDGGMPGRDCAVYRSRTYGLALAICTARILHTGVTCYLGMPINCHGCGQPRAVSRVVNHHSCGPRDARLSIARLCEGKRGAWPMEVRSTTCGERPLLRICMGDTSLEVAWRCMEPILVVSIHAEQPTPSRSRRATYDGIATGRLLIQRYGNTTWRVEHTKKT